jgi:hypothetical protein
MPTFGRLYDFRRDDWDYEVFDRFGLPRGLCTKVVPPGTPIGFVDSAIVKAAGLEGAVPIVTSCTHDTACALTAVPDNGDGWAFISCGTWALMGLEADAPVINDIAERIPSRGLVVVISDLFTPDQDALIKALHHFSYRNHEIVVMHVLADEELTFNFDGHVHFDNLEGPEDMMLDAKSIRAGYLEQVNAFLRKVGDGVRKMGADYVPMNTKIPFDKALVEYLARRRSGGR